MRAILFLRRRRHATIVDDAPYESLDSDSKTKNELFAFDNDSCSTATDVTECSTDVESLDEAIDGGIAPELLSISSIIRVH
jgi:DNA-binding transcriptional MocR family regulator